MDLIFKVCAYVCVMINLPTALPHAVTALHQMVAEQ